MRTPPRSRRWGDGEGAAAGGGRRGEGRGRAGGRGPRVAVLGSGVENQPELAERAPSQPGLYEALFQRDPSEVCEPERWLRRPSRGPAACSLQPQGIRCAPALLASVDAPLTCAHPRDDLRRRQALKYITQ